MKEKIKNEYAVKNGFDDWDDLLCNALPDFVRFAINEVMDIFVNQEVERRIAERMPSDVDSEKVSSDFVLKIFDDRTQKIRMADTMWGWQKCLEWLRSRLTNPGDSQKTEGGTK